MLLQFLVLLLFSSYSLYTGFLFHLFFSFIFFRWTSNENEISQWILFEYGFIINNVAAATVL